MNKIIYIFENLGNVHSLVEDNEEFILDLSLYDQNYNLKLDDIQTQLDGQEDIVKICSISSLIIDDKNLRRFRLKFFNSSNDLKIYEIEQQKKLERSHQHIGSKQKLFFFSEMSPGSCMFLEKGTRMLNRLYELMRELYSHNGYDEIITPNIYKSDLYKISGHYQNIKKICFVS